MGNEWNFLGSNIKEKNILNIYVLGESQNFTSTILAEKTNFNHDNLFNWINNFSNKGITNDILNIIIEEIKLKFRKNNECNSIIIFLEKQDIPEKINLIINCMKNLKKIYKPIVILAIDEENKIQLKNDKNEKIYNNNKNNKNNNNNNNNKEINNLETDANTLNMDEYIEIVFYKNNDYYNIENSIRSIYNYYYNVGDLLTNYVQVVNDFIIKNEKKEDVPSIEFKSNYKATFNILVMGRPGCGKSTLINLILNEKRAREGIGYSITKLFTQYLHKKYPITLVDTPGFEDDKAIRKMEDFINNFSFFFKEGKIKFHLVLYLINASNERTFMSLEYQLINTILKSLNIPIFFVCTRTRTEEVSINFKEEVKINLMQIFGLETKLVEHIYCCHLLNEKDGIYKRFGVDKLLRGIKEYFSKEIKKIENIEKNLEDIPSIIKTNEQHKLNILSSLENSNSFSNYLKNLSDNIIEKYKNVISKIDKYDLYIEKKLKSTIEAIKNHLAFELNSAPSQIDDTELFSEEIRTNIVYGWVVIFDRIKINKKDKLDEIKSFYIKKVNNIENFIKGYILLKIEDNNSYMKEVIQNYKKAIDSLEEISNNIQSKIILTKIN